MLMILTIFRVGFIVAAFSLFFVFSKRISKRPLKGYTFIGIGVFLIALDLVLGSLFHGNVLPEPIVERFVPIIGLTIGYFGKLIGIVFFLIGTYLLVRSVRPHLDARYLNLVENSLVGIYMVQDGVLKFVNPKFAEISGYSREELIGKPVMDLVAPKDRDRVSENIRKRIKGELAAVHYEATALKKDGDEVTVEVHGSRILYENKPAIHGVLLDVDNRKNIEQQLFASEERYTALAKSSNDIISETSIEGKFLYISDNVHEILGFNKKELLAKNLFFLVHPDDYMTVYSEFTKAIESRVSGRVIFRSRHKSGDWKWVESTCQPYVSGNGEVRVVIVSRDITLRRTLEEEVSKANKLESIGVLAGGIAHDFNNILTVILGNVSLARSLNQPDNDLSEILTDTENACMKAKELTQQFLTFSKGGEPIKKVTSIVNLLKETIDFSSHGSNVKCNLHLSEALWPVDVDEGQISQVVQNLVINAEQAMPDGGVINVFGKNISLESQNGLPLKEGNYVQISFQDHGVGISEEDLKKVFDPYFTTKERGNGLGLTTAYSIVKNHDGLLTVSSQPGDGTTFIVYLPAATLHPVTEKKDKPESVEPIKTVKGRRLLVMDDEESIRKSLKRMLQYMGYDIVLVESGEEACREYKSAKNSRKPFDAVLMDLTIPGGMGGKETVKKLSNFDAGLKAIVSSGYSNDPIMSDFKRYGFKGVITKPFKMEKLSRVLAEVIADEQNKFS